MTTLNGPTTTYIVTIAGREVYRAEAKLGDRYRISILGVQMPSWFPARMGIYRENVADGADPHGLLVFKMTGRERLTLCGIPIGWYMRKPFWKLTREVQS